MAAWQIIGYIVIACIVVIVVLGIIDMFKTIPQLWNMIPAYEEDEEKTIETADAVRGGFAAPR